MGLALLWAAPAAAQAVPPLAGSALPGAVQPGRDRPEAPIPTQPDFDFSIEAPQRSPIGRAVDQVTFTLRDIQITGAKTIPAANFHELYAKLIGKEVKLSDILDVADAIEQTYRNEGYILVRAYVPPQRCARWRPSRSMSWKARSTRSPCRAACPARRSRSKGIFTPARMSRRCHWPTWSAACCCPMICRGVNASGVLLPSDDVPGASNVNITVEQPRFTGGLGVDNRGSRYSGLWTFNADAEINSILGNDQLGGVFTTSPDASEQVAGQLHYKRAIGDDGLIGSVNGTLTKGQPGSTLQAFDVNTNSGAIGTRLTYPVIRSRAQTLQLDGGFTAQAADIDVLGSKVSHDQWRVLDISATYLRSQFLGGAWLATLGLAQGIPALGATPNESALLSRKGGFTDFTKLTGLLRYNVLLPNSFSMVLTGQGQFSATPLINGEVVSFGGAQIGRGYDPGAITGDHGLGGSAELRYDPAVAYSILLGLEPYIFMDGGQTWYIQRGNAIDASLANQYIASVGGGVRFTLPHNTTIGIEGARTLHAVPGSDAGQQATKIFLTANTRF